VDPKLRGDRVQVRFDPFSTWDKVQIYSLDGQYLGTGLLHQRQSGLPAALNPHPKKPAHSYTDLLIQQHKQQLAEKNRRHRLSQAHRAPPLAISPIRRHRGPSFGAESRLDRTEFRGSGKAQEGL
jgi:hypothetical protein